MRRPIVAGGIFFILASWQQASATPVLSLDLKLDPDAIAAGGEVEFPLVLLENRDAEEASLFDGWRRIKRVYSTLSSSQSTFVSFTPADGFVDEGTSVVGSKIIFAITSVNGVQMPKDNVGIVGRSELVIGRVRIDIGPPVPQGVSPDLLLELDLAQQGDGNPDNVQVLIDGGTTLKTLGGILQRTIRQYAPETIEFPVITVKGKKRFTTSERSVLLRGTASAVAGITRVAVVAQSGREFIASGTATWSRRVPLKRGWNRFYVYATDAEFLSSEYIELMIRRASRKR